MRCPTLAELPPPPPGRAGWPWTRETPPMKPAANAPRISVVTPSYNQGQYIEETIRSVLLQGHPDLEYFIFDAGSSDDTVEIIKKYEPWLAGWASEKDRGQAHAINKGLERFTGKIGAYINSDDIYMPGAFSHVAAEFERAPFDVFVGRRPIPRPSLYFLRRSWWRNRAIRICMPYIIGTSRHPYQLPQECVFWNAERFRASRFNEEYHFCLDAWFFSRIIPGGEAAYSSRVVGFARQHAETKSARIFDVCKRESARMDRELGPYEKRIDPADAEAIWAAYRRANRRALAIRLVAPWRDFVFRYRAIDYFAGGEIAPPEEQAN